MGLFLTFLIPKGILAKRPVFVDVTRKSGIDFKHTNGKSQRYFIVETLGSGVATFDYDNDGLEDLYIVSGFLNLHETERAFDVPAEMRLQPNVLMRNKGDLTFEDKSKESGADEDGIGRGGFYMDHNLDGCLDIFITKLDGKAT